MPEILPLIAAIAGLAGTGVGVGETLSNLPGTPKATTPSPATTDANAQQTALNQKAALTQQFPSIQQATGGALSPDAWVQLSQILSGQAGTPGISGVTPSLVNQIQAGNVNTVPQSTGLTSSTFG